jgi:hypothetical protein
VQPWERRPVEIANLFNPAFCSVLLQNAIKGFQQENIQGMPYPLLVLVLPLVLHGATRRALPSTTKTKLHVWLQRQPEVLVGFAEHTRDLGPYTKEALAFGVQTEIINICDDGTFVWVPRKLRAISWSDHLEPRVCHKKAAFVGRWLAQAGEVSTIYTMWGIRP